MIPSCERCQTCEGSAIQPSVLYLIPFWPKMACKRCHGTGAKDVSREELLSVYFAARQVLRASARGDCYFIEPLSGGNCRELRASLNTLRDAFRGEGGNEAE